MQLLRSLGAPLQGCLPEEAGTGDGARTAGRANPSQGVGEPKEVIGKIKMKQTSSRLFLL